MCAVLYSNGEENTKKVNIFAGKSSAIFATKMMEISHLHGMKILKSFGRKIVNGNISGKGKKVQQGLISTLLAEKSAANQLYSPGRCFCYRPWNCSGEIHRFRDWMTQGNSNKIQTLPPLGQRLEYNPRKG